MVTYSVILSILDLTIAWALSAFTIYSAYDLCVHSPFAPLITICLEIISLFISWSVLYIPKLIKSKFSPKNVHKNLSKLNKYKLPITRVRDDYGPRNSIENASSNTIQKINVIRNDSFTSISRYNSSTGNIFAKSRDSSANTRRYTVSDLVTASIMDIESSQPFIFSRDANNNLFNIKAHNESKMEQEMSELTFSNISMVDFSKKTKRNANNWAHFTHYYKSLADKTRMYGGKDSEKCSLCVGINLWIKMNILSPLVNNSVYVIADIIITVAWCITWEWAATYMKREAGSFSLLTWNTNDVPKFYWQLDAGFQCSAVFHYCLMLYYSNCKIKHIISLNGIIELITTPCVSYIISMIYPLNSDNKNKYYHWSLLVGPIRFLRLLRTESLIYKNFDWLGDVKVIIVGVITAFLSLLFTFTGLLFLLESPRDSNFFERPFDFFYFGIVTIGTVGYGDFAPITTAGRLLVIVIIFTSFTLGGIQLKRLKDAMSSISTSIGLLPGANTRYIVYWGPLLPTQLLSIYRFIYALSRSLEVSYENYVESIVVLTTLPLEYYKSVYLAINKKSDINICIMGGSSNLATPSYVADILLYSIMTVVVNDMSSLSDNCVGYDDSIITICDQDAILRMTSLLRYTNKFKIPMALQLSNSYYCSYLESMEGFVNVICILDLTNAFLAKSVMCRGIFYLILSLFFVPHDIDRATKYVEYCCGMFALDESVRYQQDSNISFAQINYQMLAMLKGMQYQFYRMPFAACMKGLKFGDLVRILYMYNGSILVGVIQQDGTGFICPWDYVIGQELEYQSEPFCGVVIAHLIEDIIDMALIEQFPDDLLHTSIRQGQTNVMPQPKRLEPVEENCQELQHIEIEFANYNEAVEYFNNDYPFIIVCGWPSSLNTFLLNVLNNCFNVIILAPNKRNFNKKILGRVAYIKGTGLLAEDLMNAGLLECYSLLIFNCNHLINIQSCVYNPSDNVKSERYANLMSYDHQSIFIRNLASQILESEKDSVDTNSKKLINMETCNIITEINQASSIEFLDVTFSSYVAGLTKLGAVQQTWDSSAEFILSQQITTGTVFVREMLYGLLAHSNSICQYAIDPNYIYTLLGIQWEYNRSKKKVFNMEQHIKNGMKNGSISLVEIPKTMIGKCFHTLFIYMLYNKYSICIGIYRTYSIKSNLKFSNGMIIASPQQNFILQKKDEV